MNDIAKTLCIRTTLRTWQEKSITSKIKFMIKKIKTLRSAAGYEN